MVTLALYIIIFIFGLGCSRVRGLASVLQPASSANFSLRGVVQLVRVPTEATEQREQPFAAPPQPRSIAAGDPTDIFCNHMDDATMQPCDALRIALLTRDGAEIRHWLDDGSLVLIRCSKDALRIRALVRSEGLICDTYAARLDEAQIDKFQDRVGLDYEADAIAAFAEDFARALCIRPRLHACDDDLDLTLDFSGAGVGSAKLRLRADGKVSVGLLDDLTAHFAPAKVEAPASQGLSQKRTARAFQPSKKRRA